MRILAYFESALPPYRLILLAEVVIVGCARPERPYGERRTVLEVAHVRGRPFLVGFRPAQRHEQPFPVGRLAHVAPRERGTVGPQSALSTAPRFSASSVNSTLRRGMVAVADDGRDVVGRERIPLGHEPCRRRHARYRDDGVDGRVGRARAVVLPRDSRPRDPDRAGGAPLVGERREVGRDGRGIGGQRHVAVLRGPLGPSLPGARVLRDRDGIAAEARAF